MTYLLFGYDKTTNQCQYKAAVPEKNTEDLKRLLSIGYEAVTAERYVNAVIYSHEQDPEPTTPAQLREEAYNTQAIIEWDGDMLTVTQASQKWQYYAAEGDTAKTDALTALIAEAKASIREQYPDEEGGA